ncbi:MAG: 4Fe-4S binding protein [Clostridiales bacterium]|nr:4Fe-4S binding protein [Clostridiales bacterium]
MSNAKSVRALRKAQVDSKGCVACGCCVPSCPCKAIGIFKGVFANIDTENCVGCGKCAGACPAGTITISEAVQ